MKYRIILLCASSFVLFFSGIGFCADTDANLAEIGKKLFHDSKLAGSPNDKSCSSCHPDGKGINYLEGNIYEIINDRITKFLKGKPITSDSLEARALKAYLVDLTNMNLIKNGEKLFKDPKLSGSTNDKSCNSCHPGGSKLEKQIPKGKLWEIVNRCIVSALKGKEIERSSLEMRSLRAYIRDLKKKQK